MVTQIEGKLNATGMRIALVASRFNQLIVGALLHGAIDTLRQHGASDADITEIRVPGAWELPLAVQQAARSKRYDAIVALGTVIRGATAHYDIIVNTVSSRLAATAIETNTPVTLGVLTVDTVEQAIERAGTKLGNKGAEAALAAIEMVSLARQLDKT